MTRAEFMITLTRALHAVVLSHPVYAVLITVKAGHARTVAGAAAALGLSYHSVIWHVRKYSDLFVVDRESIPHGLKLSNEGEHLLHKIETLVARYAGDDPARHSARAQPAPAIAVPA